MDGTEKLESNLNAQDESLKHVKETSAAAKNPLNKNRTSIELLDTETSRIQRELERERAQLKIQEQHLAEELSRLKQKSEQASSKEIVSERTVRAGKRILIFMIIVRLFIRIWRRFILKGKT
mmetsp:Transcript_8678/g.17183  ORF Transcript_8678/g.17183 Transcript_8678/m.17183 type:complete len:122 (+) Transcript_8678:215-580(+)|eukprot:CAMPEP_0171500558 /NCGR_PEP_ID=MMETSP0958-20121227/9054_1 /TAXON_ID=87120 /ORGANISM="Aurantiochytrium limacinum, Strain ATCCMYA-1381" /LENGTH=121 /DNA_ID=CAMNT_0012035245 /DNA_START=95 /DNA_END=460 /DNA_ORIENTATION=-